jgi:hypothetical protein
MLRAPRPLRCVAALVVIACVTGPAACERAAPKPTNTMTTEEIIRQIANAPVGQSVVPISAALATRTVFVSTDSAPSTGPTAADPVTLRFRTAQDNQGRTWAYAYTTQAELLRSFPQGSPYVELAFRDFFDHIERDARFAGIFLNSGSDSSYPIPREVFEAVKGIVRRPAADPK